MQKNVKKVFVAISPKQSLRDAAGQAGGKPRVDGRRVFVAMSGGVDSSVAAFLLKNRGYDVVGVFMRCYNLDGCAERDAEDARRVAEKLGIPFYVWDFEKEYKKKVVNYMIEGYKMGITPNPDVMCNREIKFGLFFDKALASGAYYVTTGHYVKSQIANRKSQIVKLFEADDKNKDQSYFLWTLTQKHLQHCLFPIGDYLKPEVREIARNAGLPTAEKKDSQGICFLGKITLADFLKKKIRSKRGDVLTVSGRKIGEHDGAHFYTIGQRHGINLGDAGNAEPLYVAAKDVKKNILVVAEGKDNQALYRKEVVLTDAHLVDPAFSNSRELEKAGGVSVLARVRYRQPLSEAILTASDKKQGAWKLIFNRSQKFVAPGQSAVFYTKNGEMLGGGVIV